MSRRGRNRTDPELRDKQTRTRPSKGDHFIDRITIDALELWGVVAFLTFGAVLGIVKAIDPELYYIILVHLDTAFYHFLYSQWFEYLVAAGIIGMFVLFCWLAISILRAVIHRIIGLIS